jgi:hypothetical protein
VRAAIALLGALASLCAEAVPATGPAPCPAATLAGIEAEYSESVLEQCQGYELEQCPTIGKLRAKRTADELAKGCR